MKLYIAAIFSFLFFAAEAQETIPANIYDLKVPARNGGVIDLAQYKGKKILIVNTPTEAFNNPKYTELESFYKQYKDKVVVIAVLDDDFGPAPGDSKVHSPVNKDYKVSFPMSAKVFVKGDNMTPVYHWLTEMKYNHLKDTEVKWDFQKYLINEQGQLVAVFDPKVKMNSPDVLAAIEN